MKKITEHFKSWLSGFIDGEGCFTISSQGRSKGFHIRFTVQVRADDLDVVKKIHRYLGGQYSIYTLHKDRLHQHPIADYYLSGAKNCLRLVRHIEKYPLLAKKRRDFEVWREAVYLMAGKEHLKGKRDYLLYLCDKIKKVRQYEKVKMPQTPIDRQLILLGDN